LLRREPIDVVDAVRRVVAVQAQEPASPYVALWNRIDGFDPSELDAAYTDHRIVKATPLRITLHAVAAEDHPAFHHAMVPSLRASRLNDRRFHECELSVEEVDALLPDVLAHASHARTNADMEAWLEARFGRAVPRAWWAMRTYAPLAHAVTGPPWSHGPRPSYIAAPTLPFAGDHDDAVRTVVRRYLEGFGPATAQDIAAFTILRAPVVRRALDSMAGEVVTMAGPDARPLYDVAGGPPLPDEDEPAPPRLMAMWDSCLLAYDDRSRIIPPDYRKVVIRTNGDVLPTLLVDGHVAGVWRAVDGGIEATAFHRLPKGAWDGLAAEAAALVTFLADRDPAVYRRYQRWWSSLPAADVRVLAA
jgi:hypothetical protein